MGFDRAEFSSLEWNIHVHPEDIDQWKEEQFLFYK